MANRIIDVFLAFQKSDRNTVTIKSGGKTTTTIGTGPEWHWLRNKALKQGFQLNVNGPPYTPSAATFTDSLKNSEATILIGHGAGTVVAKKWISSQLDLSDGRVFAPSADGDPAAGLYLTQGDKTVNQSRPKTNRVTAVFTCNSHDLLPKAFEIPEGDVMITNDGGDDGLTRVGTLENTGFAFVEAYIDSNGKIQESVNMAQREMNQGSRDKDNGRIKGDPHDAGDRLHIEH
jgi:hypothetical protein